MAMASVRSPQTPEASGREDFGQSIQALYNHKLESPEKVVVLFKAIGNAPIMKQNHFKIIAAQQFSTVIQSLRKKLQWKAEEPLFTYINLSFAPAPDDSILNLYKLFSTEGHLIVNYSTTAAWG